MKITNAILCAALASPLAAMGCGSPRDYHGGAAWGSEPREAVPLEVVYDLLPGARVFDDDYNDSLSEGELDLHFRVRFDKKDGNFDQADVNQMKDIAQKLRMSHPRYGHGSYLPPNMKDTANNLNALVDTLQNRLNDEQDREIRAKRHEMFPQSKNNDTTPVQAVQCTRPHDKYLEAVMGMSRGGWF